MLWHAIERFNVPTAALLSVFSHVIYVRWDKNVQYYIS